MAARRQLLSQWVRNVWGP